MPKPGDIPGVPTSTLDPFKDTRPHKSVITYLKEKMIAKFLKSALSSWKTTLLGVSIILSEIVKVSNGEPLHWEVIMAGIGLIMAKDGNVSNPSIPIPVAKPVE